MPRICSRVGPQALRLVSPTPDPDLCSAESPLIVGQAPIVKKCACPIWQSYGRVCHRSLRGLPSNLQLIGIFCMQLPFSAPAISARSTPAHYYCSISISFAGESISSLHFLPLPPHGMGWDGFCRHRFTSVLARASSVSSSWDPASACCLDMTHLDRRMHRLHPTPANLSISFPARYTNLRFIQMSHSPSPFSTLVPLKLSCRHRHMSILVTLPTVPMSLSPSTPPALRLPPSHPTHPSLPSHFQTPFVFPDFISNYHQDFLFFFQPQTIQSYGPRRIIHPTSSVPF